MLQPENLGKILKSGGATIRAIIRVNTLKIGFQNQSIFFKFIIKEIDNHNRFMYYKFSCYRIETYSETEFI